MKYNKQLFGNEAASETTTGFDKGVYCDFQRMQLRHSQARISYLQYGTQKAQQSALSQVSRVLSLIVRLILLK